MVDYLRITSLAAQRVEPELARWQVSHDFIELGDNWTETRKVRIFLNGPSLKGPGDAAYYPDGLGATPSPPGADSDAHYNAYWREELDSIWSRITKQEFDDHFANPRILERWSPLTPLEDATAAPADAIYSHYQTGFRSDGRFRFPTDIFDENVTGSIVRRVEFFDNGPPLRDNLYIQRRREFSIVYFNGSLAEGEPHMPDFDRTDVSLVRINRDQFEHLYQSAAPHFGERDTHE